MEKGRFRGHFRPKYFDFARKRSNISSNRASCPDFGKILSQVQFKKPPFERWRNDSPKFFSKYPTISLKLVGISTMVAKTNTHTQYPIPEYFDSGIGYIPDTHTRCPFSRDTHTRTHTRRDFPSGANPCWGRQEFSARPHWRTRIKSLIPT